MFTDRAGVFALLGCMAFDALRTGLPHFALFSPVACTSLVLDDAAQYASRSPDGLEAPNCQSLGVRGMRAFITRCSGVRETRFESSSSGMQSAKVLAGALCGTRSTKAFSGGRVIGFSLAEPVGRTCK